MSLDILKYILTSFSTAIVIIIILFFNPDKVEKWSVMLWKVVYFLIKKGEKKIISHDIQGRVNEFTKSLKKELANYEPVGISIQWVTEKEEPTTFFKENRLIIRMRQHNDQNKNFVYASMVFISKAFLPKAKRYLSKSQKESIDLFVGRKLMEKEKPQIVDSFFEDYFSPKAMSSEKILELLEKYEIIDKVGLFYPVLIQELTFLGEKVFYKKKGETIIAEVTAFVSFLERYANREIGEDKIPQNFEGAYCRCGIIIIAKSLKREMGFTGPYINYMNKLIEGKLENIYLIGSADRDNHAFIDQVSEEAEGKFALQKYLTKKFKAKIKMKGERKEVTNYLVLLRTSESLRYYDKEYQEQFVNQIK